MKKKILLITLVILSLSLVIFLLIINNNKSSIYILLDNTYSLEYKDGKFRKANYEDYKDSDFVGFSNNEFIGYYNIYGLDENKDVFVTNDKSDEAYSFEQPYLFVTKEIEVLDFHVEDAKVEDLKYLVNDLEINVNSIEELDSFKMIKVDIDNDNIEEYIYYANRFNPEEDDSFSCIFLVNKGKVYLMGIAELYDAYEEDSYLTMDDYSLGYILKIDNKIKLVVSMKSTDVTFYSIFSFDKDLVTEFGGSYA